MSVLFHAIGEVGGKIGQGDLGQSTDDDRAGGGIGLSQCVIDRRLDQAGTFRMGRIGHQARFTQGGMDVAQRDLCQRPGQMPATAVTPLRSDQTGLAQTGHGAADDDRVGGQTDGQLIRGHGRILVGHV